MEIKTCLNCNVFPVLKSDESEVLYFYECPQCKKHTLRIVSSISSSNLDEEAKIQLINYWNHINNIKI